MLSMSQLAKPESTEINLQHRLYRHRPVLKGIFIYLFFFIVSKD